MYQNRQIDEHLQEQIKQFKKTWGIIEKYKIMPKELTLPRPIVFGEIEEGHWFEGRKEMMPTSFHRKWGAGIDSDRSEGCSAIVLSGGYEDDEDYGDEIIYTGAGEDIRPNSEWTMALSLSQ